MQHLSSNFFLDHTVVTRFDKRIVEETKAHLIILGSGGGNDTTLTTASLEDGNAIDFLFGARGFNARSASSKANAAKDWMRSLDDHGRDATARFYLIVFQSMETYHKNMNHPCSWLWSFWLRRRLLVDIEEAFAHLKGVISENNFNSEE